MTFPTCTGYELFYLVPPPAEIQTKLIKYVETCQHHKVMKIMQRYLITSLWCRFDNHNSYLATRVVGHHTEIKIITAANNSVEQVAYFRELPWQPLVDRFRNNLF